MINNYRAVCRSCATSCSTNGRIGPGEGKTHLGNTALNVYGRQPRWHVHNHCRNPCYEPLLGSIDVPEASFHATLYLRS